MDIWRDVRCPRGDTEKKDKKLPERKTDGSGIVHFSVYIIVKKGAEAGHECVQKLGAIFCVKKRVFCEDEHTKD